MLTKIADDVRQCLHSFDLFVRNRDVEFFFKLHHDFDDFEGINAEASERFIDGERL